MHLLSPLSAPLLHAMRRQAYRFVSKPSWLSAVDLMVSPAVDDFVFTQALRMSPSQVLAGASLAAMAVNDAVRDAVQGDGDDLEALERTNSLTPSLHTALRDEVCQIRTAGEIRVGEALIELADERRILTNVPALSETLLIIGGQRDVFPRGGHQHQHQHQLAIGSHLIVCDRSPNRLWSSQRQVELLEEHGCSIHCVVSFGDSDQTGSAHAIAPSAYTFEAHVTGEMLLGSEDELHFSLANINGLAKGNAFWLAAAEVYNPFVSSASSAS